MRNKMWHFLVNMQYKGYILSLLVGRFQKLDRAINIFLAIASSASIGAWAIWKKYDMVWAAVIAASQTLTVIKPYIPFYKYAQELNSKCLRMANLNLDIERLWDKMQGQYISEEAASEMYYELKRHENTIFSFSDDLIFDVSKQFENKANSHVKNFLKRNYDIEIEFPQTLN
jgi:hypothetical protein